MLLNPEPKMASLSFNCLQVFCLISDKSNWHIPISLAFIGLLWSQINSLLISLIWFLFFRLTVYIESFYFMSPELLKSSFPWYFNVCSGIWISSALFVKKKFLCVIIGVVKYPSHPVAHWGWVDGSLLVHYSSRPTCCEGVYLCSQYLCSGSNEKCPLQAPVFEHLAPSTIWGYRRFSLVGGSMSLRVSLEPQPTSCWLFLLPLCG